MPGRVSSRQDPQLGDDLLRRTGDDHQLFHLLFELEFGNAWYSAGAIRRIYPDRVFISAAWSGSEGW